MDNARRARRDLSAPLVRLPVRRALKIRMRAARARLNVPLAHLVKDLHRFAPFPGAAEELILI